MEKYLGRIVLKKIDFNDKGTFQAYYAATGWLYENGYKYGSTCVNMPVGFIKGAEWDLPQKWYNMTSQEKNSVDGVLIGDTREGPVQLVFFNINPIRSIEKKLEIEE
jgi:hypothetical protein